MIFSVFSKKTHPGYGVNPPPPPPERKCGEGWEQKAKMAAHDDDDGNENIAKDEFVSFQTLSIWTCIICMIMNIM